eukprot:m.112965 g.112965  ORF g.112965 m.112965 type:complete len:134 (+) comp12994_c0_seq4:409-810(+)
MQSKSVCPQLLTSDTSLWCTELGIMAWHQPKNWFPKHTAAGKALNSASDSTQEFIESKEGQITLGAAAGLAGAAVTVSTGGIAGPMAYSTLAAGAVAGAIGGSQGRIETRVSVPVDPPPPADRTHTSETPPPC